MQFNSTIVKTVSLIGVTTLVASFMGAHNSNSEIVEAVPAHKPITTTISTATPSNMSLDLTRLQRRNVSAIDDGMFSLPAPPPPPPLPPAALVIDEPPAKPVAPPLPFRYLGRMLDAGVTTVFMGKDGRNLSVRVGDVIDNLYRIDAIDEKAVILTYLPLNERQILDIGRPH